MPSLQVPQQRTCRRRLCRAFDIEWLERIIVRIFFSASRTPTTMSNTRTPRQTRVRVSSKGIDDSCTDRFGAGLRMRD